MSPIVDSSACAVIPSPPEFTAGGWSHRSQDGGDFHYGSLASTRCGFGATSFLPAAPQMIVRRESMAGRRRCGVIGV
jgi:hypothetical protein